MIEDDVTARTSENRDGDLLQLRLREEVNDEVGRGRDGRGGSASLKSAKDNEAVAKSEKRTISEAGRGKREAKAAHGVSTKARPRAKAPTQTRPIEKTHLADQTEREREVEMSTAREGDPARSIPHCRRDDRPDQDAKRRQP